MMTSIVAVGLVLFFVRGVVLTGVLSILLLWVVPLVALFRYAFFDIPTTRQRPTATDSQLLDDDWFQPE